MKFEIEVRECERLEMYLHQSGFTLDEKDKKEAVVFNTTVPGGFPYIFINTGKNKGKRFIIDSKELQKLCEKLVDADV